MAAVPQVRASWLKYSIRSAKNYPPPAGTRVLEVIGSDLRAEIRATGPLGWMPVARFIQICNAAVSALGVAGARAFWRKSLHDCIQQPLIRPLALGGLHLFGHSPGGLYRRTPQAWSLVTKGVGDMTTEPGPDPLSIWIRVRGLPEGARSQALMLLWEGGFVGQADFVRCPATVDTDDRQLNLGNLDFFVRWKTPPE